ncbi:MAG: lipopolysaccharide biosynthesis-like protein [Proteobacteria bacterium]|nr:lipopolysaccharide biosynthesis-like protein [Pseudomonadota bacterium]
MKRLAIFAGYDKHGKIDDYVLYYLKELKKVADIIFVYDNDLSKEELLKVKDLTLFQITKKHGEYDFGSYKRGYQLAKDKGILENYDSLTLCNDSVYGPFREFEPIFNEFEQKEDVDFWGMFFEKGFSWRYKGQGYLHSYFIVLKKQVFLSDTFSEFINSVTKHEDKHEIVRLYELGLTQHLLKAGFLGDGLFISNANDPHGNKAIKLIEDGFPSIKRSLFDVNSIASCGKLNRYKEIIKKANPNYDISMIDKHLYRVLGEDSVDFSLTRRWGSFHLPLFHKKIVLFKGVYILNRKFKFTIDILGITIFKVCLPERFTEIN